MGEMSLGRRRVLQGMGAAASVAALSGRLGTAWADTARSRLAGVVLPPGTRPDPSRPEGVDLLPQVEHVIIYVQENHSYDHYLGMHPRGDGFTLGPGGLPTNSNPTLQNQPYVVRPATATCDLTPGTSQSWNASHISWDNGAMDGFIRAGNGATGAMTYWDRSTLPFYYGLADVFPISDRWFCSALAQTFPNRRYVQAATSVGIVSTDVNEVLATPDAPNGLIWDRLNDHGITWNDYCIDLPDILLFPNFYNSNVGHVKTFHDFLVDCADGTLPQVSIISPGNAMYSEEDPHDIQLGEAYSASIINAVLQSPLWGSTALFFTYDEHGGYYDHVPPPPAVAPDAIAPRVTSPPDQPGGFDRYGMRVPGFVISPFAKADYVSHVLHDHTSILRFIETKWNLGALTYRDANADDLLDNFDFVNPGFREPPTLPAPGLPATGSTCSTDPPPEQPIPTTTTTTSTTSTTVSSTSSLPASSTIPASVAATATQSTARFGTPTGDGVSTGDHLPGTGARISTAAYVGGIGTLAGVAAVLAARAKQSGRERVVLGVQPGGEVDD